MSAPVPLTWRLPDTTEIEAGRPVLGRTLMALAGALNHINGLHARGWVPVAAYQDAAETAAAAADVGVLTEEPEDETHRIPYYVPMGVSTLRVAIVALAYASGGSDEPDVAVSVYDSGGGVVDAGFTMGRVNGALAGNEISVAGDYWLVPFIGELANETLDVAAKEGNVVILRLDTTVCLVIAAFVMPDLAVTL